MSFCIQLIKIMYKCNIEHFNLDAILSVGYRVNPNKAANQKLGFDFTPIFD